MNSRTGTLTILLLILLVNLFTVNAIAQQAENLVKEFYNLDCEKVRLGQTFPSRWNSLLPSTKQYIAQADTQERHTGKYSLFMTPKAGKSKVDSGFIAFPLPAKFKASQITLKGWLKLQNVSDHAGIMIQINDIQGNTIRVADLSELKINGTQNWKQYTVSLPLPENAAMFYVGPILAGTGKLWADDFEILMDGVDVRDAPLKAGSQHRLESGSKFGNDAKVGAYLKLKDASLYYEIYGKGEPLLLLHGNNQSINNYTAQIPILAKTFQVIAVDTRGQGQSTDESKGPLTYEQFAADMKQLLDALHITKANILGWSDGGNTGLIMAIKYPDYVKRLAVTGAVLNSSTDAIDAKVLEIISQRLKDLKDDTDKFSLQQKRLLTLLLDEPHISVESLKSVKAPTLVMAGDKDIVKETHTRLIAESIPNSKLIIFPDATHDVPKDKTMEFNDVIRSFLIDSQ